MESSDRMRVSHCVDEHAAARPCSIASATGTSNLVARVDRFTLPFTSASWPAQQYSAASASHSTGSVSRMSLEAWIQIRSLVLLLFRSAALSAVWCVVGSLVNK